MKDFTDCEKKLLRNIEEEKDWLLCDVRYRVVESILKLSPWEIFQSDRAAFGHIIRRDVEGAIIAFYKRWNIQEPITDFVDEMVGDFTSVITEAARYKKKREYYDSYGLRFYKKYFRTGLMEKVSPFAPEIVEHSLEALLFNENLVAVSNYRDVPLGRNIINQKIIELASRKIDFDKFANSIGETLSQNKFIKKTLIKATCFLLPLLLLTLTVLPVGISILFALGLYVCFSRDLSYSFTEYAANHICEKMERQFDRLNNYIVCHVSNATADLLLKGTNELLLIPPSQTYKALPKPATEPTPVAIAH